MKKIYEGRINRKSFIIGSTLVMVTFSFLISSVSLYLNLDTSNQTVIAVSYIIYWLILSPLVVKRAHDLGKSGRNEILSVIIPIINFLVIGQLIFTKGETLSNNYGPAPDGSISFK